MITTPAQRFRLLIFLVIGLVAISSALIALTHANFWQKNIIYTANFHDSISGLERSAPVKYQGLRVGRVDDMRIAKDNPSEIEIVLALNSDVVLYQGTVALLDNSGLTGLKTINLTPGDPRAGKLAPGSKLPTGASLFDKLGDNAANTMAHVEHVTEKIAQWASEENRRHLEDLVKHIDAFIVHLDSTVVDTRKPITQAMQDFSKLSVALVDASHEVTSTLKIARSGLEVNTKALEKTLNAWQNPVANIKPQDVQDTLQALKQAAIKLDTHLGGEQNGKAVATLGDTLARANRLIADVDLAVRSGRNDFTASLSYLRQAAEDLREFSRILAQNPSVLVRGRKEQD